MPLSTKLSAVNVMLSTIGESKVSSLVSGDTDAELAEEILEEISTEFQSMGWRFNEEKRTLTPDTAGRLYLPAETLKVDPISRQYSYIVQRGDRLYDTQNATDVLDMDLEVVLTVNLEFDHLPQPARRYIEIRAARTFQKRTLGAPDVDAFTADEENKAWLTFLDFIGDTNEHNIFNNPEMAHNIDRRIGGGVWHL